MAKQKKLTLTEAKKQLKVYDERKEVNVGDGYVVNIDTKFKPTKVSKVISDMHNAVLVSHEKGVIVDPVGFLSLYIIKHFSDLDIPNDFNKQVIALDTLVDAGYLTKIMDAFDVEELKKIQEAMALANKGLEDATKVLEEQEAYQEQLLEEGYTGDES